MVTLSCKIFKIYFCIFLLKELPFLKLYKLWVPENLDFSLITALYICIPLEELSSRVIYFLI